MDFIFDPNLVLYLPLYKLDGASFMSKDAYGHLCTVTGALWRPNGSLFDGTDDYITIPNSSSLAISDVLTICSWVKTTRTTQEVILGKNYFEYEVSLVQTSNRMQAYYGNGSNFSSVKTDNVTPDIWDDRFHHVTVVIRKDGSGTGFFVDGNYIETDTSGSSYKGSGTTDIYVGVRNDMSLDFKGTIGEIQVYNRALTPQEIQHNYLATKWRYQ